jgi:hypothetical protein
MDITMEMAMAATPIAAETAGEDTPSPMERNINGLRSWRSEFPPTAGALSDWIRHIERPVQ